MLVYIFSILIGVFAWVFCNVLIADGEIFQLYGHRINRIKQDWISKPLGGCTQCFSGQVAFWLSLTYYRLDPIEIILFTTLTIFTTIIIDNKL